MIAQPSTAPRYLAISYKKHMSVYYPISIPVMLQSGFVGSNEQGGPF
jgi:hypothetical protein